MAGRIKFNAKWWNVFMLLDSQLGVLQRIDNWTSQDKDVKGQFSDHYVKRCDFEWFWATIFGVKQDLNGIAGASTFTINHGSRLLYRDQHNMLWRFYCWSSHESKHTKNQEEVWCDSALHWVFGWWKLLHAKPWTVNKIKTKISRKTIKRKLNVGSGDSIPSFAPLKLSLSLVFLCIPVGSVVRGLNASC